MYHRHLLVIFKRVRNRIINFTYFLLLHYLKKERDCIMKRYYENLQSLSVINKVVRFVYLHPLLKMAKN